MTARPRKLKYKELKRRN